MTFFSYKKFKKRNGILSIKGAKVLVIAWSLIKRVLAEVGHECYVSVFTLASEVFNPRRLKYFLPLFYLCVRLGTEFPALVVRLGMQKIL